MITEAELALRAPSIETDGAQDHLLQKLNKIGRWPHFHNKRDKRRQTNFRWHSLCIVETQGIKIFISARSDYRLGFAIFSLDIDVVC